MWHWQNGDSIEWDMPVMLGQTDMAYASCILTKNASVVANYKGLHPELIAGGTGYDLKVKLPPEIEAMKPRINYGFTTRGCIRNCPFCFVPKAEGYIKRVGNLYDLWDGRAKAITLYDNNILALPQHFEMICSEALHSGIALDFNQGLDIRLLHKSTIEWLNKIKLKGGVRFAFDSPELEPIIREKVAMLRQYYKRKYIFFYVLVGFNTTFEQDLHRCNVLRELGCRPYIMRHENTPKEKRYIRLAEWCNQFWTFAKYDYETFCREYENSH